MSFELGVGSLEWGVGRNKGYALSLILPGTQRVPAILCKALRKGGDGERRRVDSRLDLE
jgi:hypothetical protein